MKTSVLIDHEPTPAPGGHIVRALLRIEGEAPEAGDRVPLNLCVVLDNSGSMAGDKLRFAKEAARQLLSKVFPGDVASVVTFASHVDVVAEAAARRQHTALSTRIAGIGTAGRTNLSGGWLEGRAQIERHRSADASNRILLMTDGHANEGITNPDELARLLSQARAAGVTTSTIGFGRDFDERLLAVLADAGGGNTHYIEHPDQAPAVFHSELDELLTLSAQNVAAEVAVADGVTLAAVHHSYPRTALGNRLRLQMGDLYATEPKELLLELVATGVEGSAVDLARLTISAAVRDQGGGMEQREVVVPIAFSPVDGPVVLPEVRRTLVLLEAAVARREALSDEGRGSVAEGAYKLREAARRVRELGNDPEVAEEVQDLELMASRMIAREYDESDRKYTRQRDYYRSRSKGSRSDTISRSGRPSVEPGDRP